MKKLTTTQYMKAYAMVTANVAWKLAPLLTFVLAYHYFGVPGLLAAAAGFLLVEAHSELDDAIKVAEMHIAMQERISAQFEEWKKNQGETK